MTQAFNLSQLANNLNSTGQLDATDGLVNAVPVANGGTGASSASAARTNLGLVIGTDVPSPTGGGASGNWPINASTASNPAGGGSFITSSNIGSQSVSYATSAGTAGNGGVTSVNGATGAVSAAPVAKTTSGSGQWVAATFTGAPSSATVTLPSGGTWAWFLMNNNGGTAGVDAGGTVIYSGGVFNFGGFFWRVS